MSLEIIDDLGSKIVQGIISDGTVLPRVEEYSEQLGVSRTVIREVYLSLNTKQLVKSIPKIGTVVQPSTKWLWWDADILSWASAQENSQVFSEINQIRLMLEPSVCELAAICATEHEIKAIADALENLKQSTYDVNKWAIADLKFHELILFSSKNQLLTSLGKLMHKPLLKVRIRLFTELEKSNRPIDFRVHGEILAALRSKNGQAAKNNMYTLIKYLNEQLELIEK